MRSQSSITGRREALLAVVCLTFLLIGSVSGQRLAILTPDNTAQDVAYTDDLAERVPSPIRVIYRGQADAAFRSVTIDNSFNMTTTEAKAVATVVGCDAFVVARSAVIRRTTLNGYDYFEAYAAHFLVDGRTGELVHWRLHKFEDESEQKARAALAASIAETARALAVSLRNPTVNAGRDTIEPVPDEGTPAAANLKTPVPYKRIKPEYTSTAFLYAVKATVEIEVDIAADGAILGMKIVRWAGYGLDESVETAVRAMNWRPAMRNGKPLPMRVLLRYNFTKVEKE